MNLFGMIIDPPSGWLYGFPKKIDALFDDGESLSSWLVNNGYPEDMVPLALRYSRYWSEIHDL